MKSKFPSLDRQRMHRRDFDKMFQMAGIRSNKTRIELESILRWEDDGGIIIELKTSAMKLLSNPSVFLHANDPHK